MFPPENASNLKVSAIWLAPDGSPRTNKPGLNQQPLKGERGRKSQGSSLGPINSLFRPPLLHLVPKLFLRAIIYQDKGRMLSLFCDR